MSVFNKYRYLDLGYIDVNMRDLIGLCENEEQSRSWPPILADGFAIADYIETVSSDYVDNEFIAEHFRGAKALLKRIPLDQIKAGEADNNISSKKKMKKYAAMDPLTMPPLVIEDGQVVDGNHRLRVAQHYGLKEIWCYVVEYP